MIQCIFNIGYFNTEAQNFTVLNVIPYITYFKTVNEMTTYLRGQMSDVYEISLDGGYPKSNMALFIKVIVDYGEQVYERDFIIRCVRVREYSIILRNNLKR